MLHFDIRFGFFMIELLAGTVLFSRHCGWRRSWRLLVLPLVVVLACLSTSDMPQRLVGFTAFDYASSLLYYLIHVVVVVLLLRIVTRASWLESLVVVAAGYATQHIAYDMMKLVMIGSGHGDSSFYFTPPYYAMYIAVYAAVYGVIWLCFARRFDIDDDKVRHAAAWVGGGMALLVLVIAFNLFFVLTLPISSQMVCFVYDAICTVLGLLTLTFASSNDRLQNDLRMMRQINRLQEKHYELTKENIDLINIKCHDIRKNIATLYRDTNGRPSDASIRQVEDSIRIYDSIFRTGNEAMDVLLTEKSLYCSANAVTLTCMVDGNALDFMEASDLYALFSNILDNAIESAVKLDDPGRRTISLTVRTIGKLLICEEQNYYAGELTMRDGLPVTTKSDTRFHGFGMRSIAYQVRKYQGELRITGKDGVFSMTVILPLPE
ncbi:ATP-binding protein [Bifidobacterium scardovii]|uniref:Histidine kinase n=1 Tax=Bifidobacterium scardovii TaxID=158787 RepID=A0A087D5B9_9BIFI|nr:ATP-binding protein [Bifidobacterium scardovii]KFI90719.1 histidine kinase [Bifidobacterium scardovii]MBS6947801.1 sensor histidine kinase [Bifidobacterium scardovii]MDK6349939.1 ATP-binding protein [Bifidobacterium scardovii]MDU3737151.1 ATP-binding protein [Bifidobacterium scardovii]MDU5297837.1 ATP-binding protein [Bifidobacterium scardovii]